MALFVSSTYSAAPAIVILKLAVIFRPGQRQPQCRSCRIKKDADGEGERRPSAQCHPRDNSAPQLPA